MIGIDENCDRTRTRGARVYWSWISDSLRGADSNSTSWGSHIVAEASHSASDNAALGKTSSVDPQNTMLVSMDSKQLVLCILKSSTSTPGDRSGYFARVHTGHVILDYIINPSNTLDNT